ncbi:YrzI family small protein [Actinomycetes bacterium NPDC127524]
MKLNIIFLTITIKKSNLTKEESIHQENIRSLRDHYRNRGLMQGNIN